MEQRDTAAVDSQQWEQISKVSIPPHCPKEVTLWRSHVLRDVSLIGHRTVMQLEVNLRFTGPSEMTAGSVITPEKVPPVFNRKILSILGTG